MRPLRILVNGATGALGRATLAAVAAAGHHPVAGTRRGGTLPPQAIFVPADGRADPAVLTDIDAIINCAGRVEGSEKELYSTNVEHVGNLGSAAATAGVRRFVQVGSFSVYGPVELIGRATPVAPSTAYGHSKSAAEQALYSLGDAMSVRCLRLPFMFDRGKPALMAPLIAMFRNVPLFPVSPQPVARSMLTYPDAAVLLVRETVSKVTGSDAVADPTPFTYELLAELLRMRGLRAPTLVRVPGGVVSMLRRYAPSIGQRLFASSVLEPDANPASRIALPHGLRHEIAMLLEPKNDRTATP